MDADRPSVSRSSERPITRWRREPEPIERQSASSTRPSSGASRSYSKMERPTSRRGIKNDITEFGISRPPTSGKNTASRPPSANGMASRVPTAAPRLNTMSSINLSRMNSGLPRNFPPSIGVMQDRPLTQQGLAGLRPSSSRGDPRAVRQIQDKKYHEQILKFKIQEVKHEIVILNQYIERHNMEKADENPQHDQKSGEFAAQMVELQAQLAEYNMFLDKLTSASDKDDVDTAVKQLKELSNAEEAHRSITPPPVPERKKPKEKISPVKQEAYNLYVKIFESEQKRNRIADDSLTSAEEKDRLLKKIKQDGLKAALSEKQEKQKADSETDLESNNGENNKKEEIMDIFKSTMEKNKADELEKLNYLEEQILEHLEVISSNIDATLDSNILDSDEVELLKTLMHQNFENHNAKSLEELRQDNKKSRQFLSKLESLELKIISEINKNKENPEVEIAGNSEIYGVSDKVKNDEFTEPEKRTQRLEAIKRDHSKLKADIEKNEIYRSISILEDKLGRVMFDNESLKRTIEEQKQRDDSSSLTERLAFLTTQYNAVLINEMKSVY
ncbi:intraflagellar transport protein 74 homolog [Nasonia vitripennis]|uniref:Uncharacterized protein n=1 Tax=Nasonia vitripennis TaxID=7425 RepID=A0A7M7HC24_NASVI|nr:intraflagellar transport protein 74 homolog [Nasonia vitripennis]